MNVIISEHSSSMYKMREIIMVITLPPLPSSQCSQRFQNLEAGARIPFSGFHDWPPLLVRTENYSHNTPGFGLRLRMVCSCIPSHCEIVKYADLD